MIEEGREGGNEGGMESKSYCHVLLQLILWSNPD